MKITKEVDEHGNIFYLNELVQLHREDGPAVEYADGGKEWFINDKRHREDGPAIEWADRIKIWYINGYQYSEQEFNNQILKKRLQKIMEL